MQQIIPHFKYRFPGFFIFYFRPRFPRAIPVKKKKINPQPGHGFRSKKKTQDPKKFITVPAVKPRQYTERLFSAFTLPVTFGRKLSRIKKNYFFTLAEMRVGKKNPG